MSRVENPAPPWLERAGATLAFVVPVLCAAARFDSEPRWDEDVAIVRALGGVQVGAEGLVSSALAAVAGLVPIGSRVVRAALVSALAQGAAALVLYRCVLRLLAPRGAAWSDVGLGLFAALGACLLPSWQIEGTRVGGGTVAAWLVLLVFQTTLSPAPSHVLRGILLGLVLIESRGAAAAAACVVLVSGVQRGAFGSVRTWLESVAALLATLAVGLLPSLLHGNRVGEGFDFSLSPGLPLGRALTWQSLPSEFGVPCLLLLAFGLATSLARPNRRAAAITALSTIPVALLSTASGARLAALASGMLVAAIGLRNLLLWLPRWQLHLESTLTRLVLLASGCLVLLTAEDGQRAVERRSVSAARAWTDEAFGNLAPGTLAISDSVEIAWRLWAARVTEGLRPDVMLVPSPLLGHGNVARELIQAEPRLAGLIRDYASRGTASELSLSELADTRPLKVEPNYDWDRRLLSYLTPDGVWSDVAPHALGRSDRKGRHALMRKVHRRVFAEAATKHGNDADTLARLTSDLHRQALVSATLGDRRMAEGILRELVRMRPDDPRWQDLQDRMKESPRGAVSVRALLQ